jgi:hypothetical protein
VASSAEKGRSWLLTAGIESPARQGQEIVYVSSVSDNARNKILLATAMLGALI